MWKVSVILQVWVKKMSEDVSVVICKRCGVNYIDKVEYKKDVKGCPRCSKKYVKVVK